MELRQLRSFLMLVEEGTFRGAAERLHIVQPALTQQMQLLEEELGSELLVRTSRGVKLTAAGEAFQAEARWTLAHADRARHVVAQASRGQLGTVRIGFVGAAAITGRLSSDLKRFHKEYPKVALELHHEMSAPDQADAIEAGRLDLGYCRTNTSEQLFRLQTDLLSTWTWVVAMAADHPLATRQSLQVEDIREEQFIVFGRKGDNAGQLVTLRNLLDREPESAYQLGNTLAVLSLAAAGVGIALAPEPISHLGVPHLQFRPISGFRDTTNLVLLSRPEETQPAVSNFRALALNSAQSIA